MTSLGAAVAQPQYFCRMAERVVMTCCCTSVRERPSHCEVRISARDCCERVAPLASGPASSPHRSDPIVAPAVLSLLLAEPAYRFERALVESVVVRQSRGPPPRSAAPVFMANCALLI
jgi:hypothetical protein